MTLSLLLHTALLACISSTVSSVTLISYGSEAGDTTLASGDDANSGFIPVTNLTPFLGSRVTAWSVNINGFIQPDGVSTVWKSGQPLPKASLPGMLAPFFGDVDTTTAGKVYYRFITNTSQLATITSSLFSVSTITPSVAGFTPLEGIVATWDSVGYFNRRNDTVNTFQAVLLWTANDTYSCFLYPTGGLNWFNSTLSDKAVAGFNAPGGINVGYSLPGSLTADILNLPSRSTFGVSGLHCYKISEAQVVILMPPPPPPSPPSPPPPMTTCNFYFPNYFYEANKTRTTHTYKTLKNRNLSTCIAICNADKRKCQGFVYNKRKCQFKLKFGGNSRFVSGSQVWVKCNRKL